MNELNELRDEAYENSLIYKEKTKKIHDSKIKNRVFNVGDRVLLFNSRLKIFSGKLKTRWSGPFTITQVFPYGTIELSQNSGPNFKVNGHRLKHYFGGDVPQLDCPDCEELSCLYFYQEFHILSFILGIQKRTFKKKAKNKQIQAQGGKGKIVEIVLWYLDSGLIIGYEDLQIGNILISRVYFVEGLGHNLFSAGQFWDSNLEVAFRKHTCFVRNLEGVDLLSASRGSNLYTISTADMMKSSPICLLYKASKTKSWLWHHQLSHLNFGTINQLAKQCLVKGLPKLKYTKDHLCSACQMGKSKKESHLLIMEYLMNISKRRAFWSLNKDILKITILKTNTPYPSRKIWRIRSCTHQRPQRNKDQYANMTMEEYIKLEEEKARRRGRVFNWQTATNGKIRVDDDLYDLRSMEAEFPAIVIDDTFTPQDALPCKSQVSTLVNDEIDFRISFGESDDEDYTIICDKNSFSYKMISFNNLKTDSENDNENAGIPYFPLPKPMTSYVNDLDFFKDFENEFPAIVYNDAQTALRHCPVSTLKRYIEDGDLRKVAEAKDRMVMEHRDDAGIVVFTSRAWGRLFDTRGPLVEPKRRLSWRQFILALGLHTGEEMESPSRFVGLTVIAPELPIIDMGELVRLQICMEVDDTWAWVAIGPEKQPDAAAGSPAIAKDAPAADEGDQAIPAPLTWTCEEIRYNQGRFSIWMMSCMAQLMDASGLTYQAFDGTFRGSSPAAFQRRTRQRNDEANTSAA
ncbi:retrovirus-related pol polyprotein from transposon TNT 1-94 [Tanacetum coccineum]